MLFNNSVTLYHINDNSYSKKYFVRACAFKENKINAGNGGQVADNSLVVRIFTADTTEISPGDKFVLGHCESASPPENSHIILSVSSNHRGSLKTRHYKIKAV